MDNYKGNINAIFFELLDKKDGFTVGQKLTQIEKTAKKRFFDMTDKEIYEVMENYVNEALEEDLPLTAEEFNGFIEILFEQGERRTIFGLGKYYSK